MTERRVGKPAPSVLEGLLGQALGAPSEELLVGPGPGLDAAVLAVGADQVMVVAEDPIFPAPELPLSLMGDLTVHIGASDVAVTGVTPRFLSYTLLLPGATPESDARTVIHSIGQSAAALGITVVGGHTGWYDAVNVPLVGGVTVWGFAPRDAWIAPGGARPGDRLLMTKGPGIEAAALLYPLYAERLGDALEAADRQRLTERVREISVVAEALAAAEVGGVHAMHDATEGGVLGGLWEMQTATGLPVQADLDAVTVPADIQALAEALGFDPWAVISEGTLLAAVDPASVAAVRRAWDTLGLAHCEIGSFGVPGHDVARIRRNGYAEPLQEPGEDPFWPLFFAGLG